MKRYEEAYNLKDLGICNCAQAVLKAYADITGVDE